MVNNVNYPLRIMQIVVYISSLLMFLDTSLHFFPKSSSYPVSTMLDFISNDLSSSSNFS